VRNGWPDVPLVRREIQRAGIDSARETSSGGRDRRLAPLDHRNPRQVVRASNRRRIDIGAVEVAPIEGTRFVACSRDGEELAIDGRCHSSRDIRALEQAAPAPGSPRDDGHQPSGCAHAG
jgi:hypothetical protein